MLHAVNKTRFRQAGAGLVPQLLDLSIVSELSHAADASEAPLMGLHVAAAKL